MNRSENILVVSEDLLAYTPELVVALILHYVSNKKTVPKKCQYNHQKLVREKRCLTPKQATNFPPGSRWLIHIKVISCHKKQQTHHL